MPLVLLQELCAVVQHHMQLICQLQQQMWACLDGAAQASSTTVLLGLQQQYMRTAGAMLSIAAPISLTGTTYHICAYISMLYVCIYELFR